MLLDPRGQPLVPLRATLEYLQIPFEDRGDTLALQWPPGVWSTRVDLATRAVSSGGASFVVAEEEWVRREREAFLSPAALGRVLGARGERRLGERQHPVRRAAWSSPRCAARAQRRRGGRAAGARARARGRRSRTSPTRRAAGAWRRDGASRGR